MTSADIWVSEKDYLLQGCSCCYFSYSKKFNDFHLQGEDEIRQMAQGFNLSRVLYTLSNMKYIVFFMMLCKNISLFYRQENRFAQRG